MNIWFTSDTHASHRNITGEKLSTWKSGFRNFESIKEMDDTMIETINKYVKENDILYHLGDFAFGSPQKMYDFRKSLDCKNIHLIKGNHDEIFDEDNEDKLTRLSFNPYELFTSVKDVYTGYIGKNKFHLSHYAHRVWPQSHKGAIHLYGHSHGGIKDFGKSMDVGIDAHKEFRPFHINEILQIMEKREIAKNDSTWLV
jgi:calcineurin-like phosphoesterase family protein